MEIVQDLKSQSYFSHEGQSSSVANQPNYNLQDNFNQQVNNLREKSKEQKIRFEEETLADVAATNATSVEKLDIKSKGSVDTPGYKLLKKFRQADRKNIQIKALNHSIDYPPLVAEQQRSRMTQPDTGIFIPKGNPYQVTQNSEVLLIQNRKPILQNQKGSNKQQEDEFDQLFSQSLKKANGKRRGKGPNFLPQVAQSMDLNARYLQYDSFNANDINNSPRPAGGNKQSPLNIDSTKHFQTLDSKDHDGSSLNLLGQNISKNQGSFITALENEPIGIGLDQKLATGKSFHSRNRAAMLRSVDYDRIDRLARKEGPYALHREGKIREVANLTDLRDASLEMDLLRTVQDASPKSKKRIENVSMSRGGQRFYTSSKRDLDVMHRQSIDIANSQRDPLDPNFKPTDLDLSVLPSIKKGRAVFSHSLSHTDPRVVIQNCSITQRYLTRNVFQSNKLPQKESVRDSIDNLRSIQITQLMKIEKENEAERLKIHLDIETDKFYKTREKAYAENKLFNATLAESTQKAQELDKENEKMFKKKNQLDRQIDALRDKILDNNRKSNQVEYLLSKEIENKKFMVEIKNSKQQNNKKSSSKSPQKNEMDNEKDNGLVDISDSIEKIMDKMTKSQMHQIMHSIENQNLFIINLINDVMEGKKKQNVVFQEHCADIQAKIDKISSLVEIKTNELREKKQKSQVLLNSYKGMQDGGNITKKKNQGESRSDEQGKRSGLNSTSVSINGGGGGGTAGPDQEDWDAVFTAVERPYRLLAGQKEKGERSQTGDGADTNILKQLMFIEHKLNYMIEVRDYLTGGLHYQDLNRTFSDKAASIKDIFEFEKGLVRDKKAERQYQQIQEEREAVELKKIQQEQKIRESAAGNNGMGQKLKIIHLRTNKPERKKYVEDPLSKYTNDELDYMYYVEGLNKDSIKDQTQKNKNIKFQAIEMLRQEDEEEEDVDKKK